MQNFHDKYPPNINTPLLCIGPLILTSLSIFTIPLFPGLVVTVILEGLPNEYSPVLSTDNPFITPTLFL